MNADVEIVAAPLLTVPPLAPTPSPPLGIAEFSLTIRTRRYHIADGSMPTVVHVYMLDTDKLLPPVRRRRRTSICIAYAFMGEGGLPRAWGRCTGFGAPFGRARTGTLLRGSAGQVSVDSGLWTMMKRRYTQRRSQDTLAVRRHVSAGAKVNANERAEASRAAQYQRL